MGDYTKRDSMIEEFECRGVWWLPEDPNRKASGILKFSPDEGIRLELTYPLETDNHLSLWAPELIFGETENGKATLYHCLETKRKIISNNVATSEVVSEIAVLGSHVDLKKDVFSSMRVESPELDLWASLGWVALPDRRAKNKYWIRCYIPDELHASLNDGTRVALGAKVIQSQTLQPPEVRLRQKTYVKVTPSSPCPFERCLDLLQTMLDLVSPGLSHPATPSEIVGDLKSQEKEVKILYQLSRKQCSNQASLNPLQTLFTYADISDRFGNFIRGWFGMKDRLRPVLNLYFATLYAQGMYVESYFLNVIQALEAYHRLAIGGQDLPEDEHQKRVNEIVNSTPPQHQGWLKNQLKYSNEKSLRSRLREICRMFQPVTEKLIGSKRNEDVESFIDKVVNTRNYLTHYDPALAEKAVRGRQLFYLTQRLKVLLECCLLRELEFPNNFKKSLQIGFP